MPYPPPRHRQSPEFELGRDDEQQKKMFLFGNEQIRFERIMQIVIKENLKL